MIMRGWVQTKIVHWVNFKFYNCDGVFLGILVEK